MRAWRTHSTILQELAIRQPRIWYIFSPLISLIATWNSSQANPLDVANFHEVFSLLSEKRKQDKQSEDVDENEDMSQRT